MMGMKNSEEKERFLISCSKSPRFLRDHLARNRRMKKWYYWIAAGMVLICWSLNLIFPETLNSDLVTMRSNDGEFSAAFREILNSDRAAAESSKKFLEAVTLIVCLGCFLGWLWAQGRIQHLLLIQHQQEAEQGDT